ncbi:MAG: histone deacetylase family protein [Planctomycetota bacterium]|nr:histone deacetylase family protein [Planctomycetota bacterium]
MTLLLVSHPSCALHETGPGHPERRRRHKAVARALEADLGVPVERVEAPAVDREAILRVHAKEHVAQVYSAAPERGLARLDPDTFMGPHSLEAAEHAAGGAVHAVDRVVDGSASQAFCNVRPPGHHAERNRVMGFCLFNNVAVAAAHALDHHGLSRVAIVDFDVHHGNGTEDIFRDDDRVLFCSSFQHPLYPNSGADTKSFHIKNVPLPAGTDGAAWRPAVAEAWFDTLAEWRPEMLFFSAGFDAHLEDPLANLALVEDDYTWITSEVRRVTDAHTGGRVVSMLEGGYNLDALGRSAYAHVRALGEPPSA